MLHANADQESSVRRPHHSLPARGYQTAAYGLRPSRIPVEPASVPLVIARPSARALLAEPFGDAVRVPLEGRLGSDFSQVRTHSDLVAAAAGSAPAIGDPQQAPAAAWPTPIQCCGIGTSCDCPPHEKLAGTQHDLQTAAVPRDLALPAPLTVGRADDPAEHEADRIAERVSRMPGPQGFVTTSPPRPRRAGMPDSGNAGVRMPSLVHEVLRSPGRPLDAASQGFMEHRFGRDFSQVRVHDDARAALSARALNAHAYTLGYDVVFGTGKYSPNSADGRRLLAHELVHVVQQGGAILMERSRSTYTGDNQPAGVIQRSESVHPEEQYCDDLSEQAEPPCAAIIECIKDLIKILEFRFGDFQGDPGHLERIQILQGILSALMVKAFLECKQGEYSKELEEEADKWVNKKVVRQTEEQRGPATEEQKKTLRERLPSLPEWVIIVIGAGVAALIIACFASGACEVAAIIAAAGEAIGWLIVAAMRLASIGLLAQNTGAPSGDEGTSAVA